MLGGSSLDDHFFNARLIKWSLNKDYPLMVILIIRIRGHDFFCFILLQLTAKLFHYQLMSHVVFYFENPVQHCIKQRCSNVT